MGPIVFNDTDAVATIRHRDATKHVPDGDVHLVVTSPPYPMIERWDEVFVEQGAESFDEMHDVLFGAWANCYEALVDGGLMCVNIGDATRSVDDEFQVFPNHARVIEDCLSLGFTPLPYILWKKPTNKPNSFLGSGMLPPNAYVTIDCEFILIFRKGGLRDFEPHDDDRYASKYTQEQRNRWFSQIWEIPGAPQDDGFASFPYDIPNRLVQMFSVRNDVVFDPFCGTGTTLEAAVDNGRRALGYDIDPKAIKAAVEVTA